LGEAVEGVVEALPHVGVSEAPAVGREDVEAVGDRGGQVAELMRGGREAAEQQQRWAVRVACLPGRVVQLRDLGGSVPDHGVAPFGLVFRATLGPRPGGRGSYTVERTSGRRTQTGRE